MNKYLEQFGKLGYSIVNEKTPLPDMDIAEDFILVKVEVSVSEFGGMKVDNTRIATEANVSFWSGTILMVGGKNEYLVGKRAMLKEDLKGIPIIDQSSNISSGEVLMLLTHIDNIIALSH